VFILNYRIDRSGKGKAASIALEDIAASLRYILQNQAIKKSSAQITALYSPEDLLGRQVICCVNLTPMHIGSVKSEVRILGTDSEQGVALLMPTERVKNGDPVF
jgi:tRNA-binding EMAP/Myf-like protein